MSDQAQPPFHRYLSRLHAELSSMSEGAVADYIPELARAAPDRFGIAFATTDGAVYAVGDHATPFSIQSVSKPFAYGGALMRLGQDAVLKKVGVAPTGEAFNSIVLDDQNNRPFNPMVNAGAIAVSALTEGATQTEREAANLRLFSRFAGRTLGIDEAVYRSESETGHRNRAIAYLMLNSGMIDRPPEDVLDLYFRQCALEVTVEDLAIMGAVLANGGLHPRTGDRILDSSAVRDVLTLMLTCGMYDYAGEWSYDVGLPAKSGVSGAVLAILPGRLSVAIWSPPLDGIGNSVRGIAACRRISRDFGLHMLSTPSMADEVIRRVVRGDTQRSRRIRNPRDRDVLSDLGRTTVIVELQGQLHFASAERMLRGLEPTLSDAKHLILDLRRVLSIDAAARRFIAEFVRDRVAEGMTIVFADLPAAAEVAGVLRGIAAEAAVDIHDTVDGALEERENALLQIGGTAFDFTRYALDSIGLFIGLDAEALRILEDRIHVLNFEQGATIVRNGDPGDSMFVVARGSVGIWIGESQTSRMRVGGVGPGQFFGEIAALGGGNRTADAVADERVVCYSLSRDALEGLSRDHPAIMATMLMNLASEFGDRLRQANRTIGALR